MLYPHNPKRILILYGPAYSWLDVYTQEISLHNEALFIL